MKFTSTNQLTPPRYGLCSSLLQNNAFFSKIESRFGSFLSAWCGFYYGCISIFPSRVCSLYSSLILKRIHHLICSTSYDRSSEWFAKDSSIHNFKFLIDHLPIGDHPSPPSAPLVHHFLSLAFFRNHKQGKLKLLNIK